MYKKWLHPDTAFTKLAIAAVALLLAFCWVMVLHYDGPRRPFMVANRNLIHVYGCALTSILLIVYAHWRKRELPHWAAWTYMGMLTAIMLVMGGTTMISNGISKGMMLVHRHDSYHYLLGAKYYPELQYNLLYQCTVAADAESVKPAFRENDRVRDLGNYLTMRVAGQTPRWQKECRDRFSPARWGEFKDDIELYKKTGDIKGYVRDMGYNGSPFHAFVMGNIANMFPLTEENLRYATLIDMTLICLGVMAIIWAAGWHAGLLASIYFFTFVGDRFYIIGNSYGRYLWWFLLMFGICLLVKKRFLAGGFSMMLSAMMTVFPAVFFGGLGLLGIRQWMTDRRFPKDYGRMVIGAIAGLVFAIILGSAQGEGIRNFENHAQKVKEHSEPMTSKRVNLRYLFFVQDKDLNDQLSIIGDREEIYDTMKPFIYVAIGFFIVLAAMATLSFVRDPADAAIFMGAALMVSITPIVCYYFTATCLLVILFRKHLQESLPKVLLAAMFAGMGYMIWLGIQLDRVMDDGEVNAVVLNQSLTTYLVLSLLAITLYWFIKAPLQRRALPQRGHPL